MVNAQSCAPHDRATPRATGESTHTMAISAGTHWVLVPTVVCWFGFSALCTSCGKATLNLLQRSAGSCALTLTAMQFLLSAIVTTASCVLLRRSVPPAPREVALVSLSYTMGFLLLNCSMGRLQASFSETVRGLEPLTSFILVRLLAARGGQLSSAACAALLAVLAGAAVSVWAQPAFDPRGFAFGLLANVGFSSRALFVTRLQDVLRRRAAGAAVAVDAVGLFAVQHIFGLLLLAPVAFSAEGTQCAVAITRHSHTQHMALLSSVGFLAYNFLSLLVLLLIDAVSHSVRRSPHVAPHASHGGGIQNAQMCAPPNVANE